MSVSNHGSALGEAIGNIIENALNDSIREITERLGYLYITTGPKNHKTNKNTKLLLYDDNGVGYSIDSVIANDKLQPLILLESKYIRYKKHNRDKGSWVCTAHQSLRKRYSSVRSSITILAGSWSSTSKAMMRGADITLFEIPFDSICDILEKHNIIFRWEEKDTKTPETSWGIYNQLPVSEHKLIGNEIIHPIIESLDIAIERILDDTIERTISYVQIQVFTNLGETKIFKFDVIQDALEFLQDVTNEELLDNKNSPTLFDTTLMLEDTTLDDF